MSWAGRLARAAEPVDCPTPPESSRRAGQQAPSPFAPKV